jgi:glycosyltransferase involved in cell wall biosynthesis
MQFLILSTTSGYGGAEMLAVDSALSLRELGHAVAFDAPWIGSGHRKQTELEQAGVNTSYVAASTTGTIASISRKLRRQELDTARPVAELIEKLRPDFAFLNLGIPSEGAAFFSALEGQGIPYVTLSHLVDPEHWPIDSEFDILRSGFGKARRNFFVSKQGLELLYQALSLSDENANLALNPFGGDYAKPLPWPSDEPPLRLACPARLLVRHKGQDLLLRALQLPHWTDRELEISLFGDGPNRRSLEEMAKADSGKRIRLCGHVNSVEEMWRNQHALIMPSRREGLPIAIVEAMLAGRPCIATDVGGNAEIIEDGVTGFIAQHPTVAAISATLERVWQSRDRLREMGEAAARRIRELYPADPGTRFAQQLEALANSFSNTSPAPTS